MPILTLICSRHASDQACEILGIVQHGPRHDLVLVARGITMRAPAVAVVPRRQQRCITLAHMHTR